MFSASRLDADTRLLLDESATPPATGDLGARYGPIALMLAAQAPGRDPCGRWT